MRVLIHRVASSLQTNVYALLARSRDSVIVYVSYVCVLLAVIASFMCACGTVVCFRSVQITGFTTHLALKIWQPTLREV